MSIETLLEAAKFVEWSAQIGYGARANDDEAEVPSVGRNGESAAACVGVSATAVSSSPASSPGSSSPVASSSRHNVLTSNTDTVDEGDDKRSGTREVHNKLEKNRRAHLKECFDNLRDTIPNMDDKKMKPSNLSILQGALRYLQALKRKERDLEYETEKLARQKIQYQDKLVRMRGSYSPWKMEDIDKEEEDEKEEEMDTDEEDRASVSTSTSTASEAEEEERKSRAQSPELKFGQVMQRVDAIDQRVGPPQTVRTDQSLDHIIKSGPFVISRRIVTHVPISTAAGPPQVPTHVPIVAKQQHQQGSTPRKVATQPQAMTVPPVQKQPWGGNKRQLTTAKDYVPHQDQTMHGIGNLQHPRTRVITQVMVKPQIQRVTSQKVVTTTQKLVVTTQSTAVTPVVIHQTAAQSQPKTTPLTHATAQLMVTSQTTAQQLVPSLTPDQPQLNIPPRTTVTVMPKVTSHQVIRHSTAVSAVQEHLKNKAQSKQSHQQQKNTNTISHTTPSMDSLTSKLNVTIVSTSAITTVTTSGSVSRQTVSQLLGKQGMVIRQPVRRTDNKFVVQRVTRHPFSPRSQTVDIMPKSSMLLTSTDTAATQVSYSLAKPVTMVTSTEPYSVHANSATASAVGAIGSAAVTVSQAIPTCSVALQHVTPPPGLDVRSFIAGHNAMLASIPHYLPQAGLAPNMIRPNLSNPNMLNATNAALLSQAMLANTRTIAPQLTITGGKDKNHVKLHSPLTSPLQFLSPSISQQAKVSGISQGKLPSLTHATPINPGHSFISPGLTLQPALTQVLFTQPPVAAYSVANSSINHPLMNAALPPSVIRHPLVPTVGVPHIVTTASAVGTSNTSTTISATLSPVVTIGAVAFNSMLSTNRAVVTAPTYTTLSFGPFPPYRFPFTDQVPLISPVAVTGNASGIAMPVTSVANQTLSNGRPSNGVIVHTLSVPTAAPVSNAWLNSSSIRNGLPTKELTFPVSSSGVTSTSATMATTLSPSAVTDPSVRTTQENREISSQVTSACNS